MSELKTQFEKAAADVQTLSKRPGNEALLDLYALYKQATIGDATGSRPGMLDMVGRAKYDAWVKLKKTSKEDAMKQYVAYVEKLKKK
ncbi:MAG: acyl-CoA-binding protein [Chloroflexi bacterium]|nr:acyl-CoA-binding protein [Chloroflexota bacterium]MBP8056417.1 acyl-CoA-binding protein [Chloroflexota bacterium]